MSKEKRLVAVCASDLHLDHIPPLFRSAEPEWMATQRGYLKQLRDLTKASVKNSFLFTGGGDSVDWVSAEVPIIIAGDIFNKSKASHEIINMAIRELPGGAEYNRAYAVCGNHDAPNHKIEEMHKSAYGILKESKRITDLEPGKPIVVEGKYPMRLHGFPCGYPVESLKDPNDFYLEIAVVHDYLWHGKSTGYEGAPENKRLKSRKDHLVGYDVAIFGDNHIGFLAEVGTCKVINCGTFMIRKSDERDYKPSVGLISSDGSVEQWYLDTSQDKYLGDIQAFQTAQDLESCGFIEELLELGDKVLNFSSYLRRIVENEKVPDRVKRLVLASLEKGEGKE